MVQEGFNDDLAPKGGGQEQGHSLSGEKTAVDNNDDENTIS